MAAAGGTDRVRRYFDRRALAYRLVFANGPLAALRRSERRAIFELLEPTTEERVLDAGCGPGLDARRLAELGCIVDGVDLSPNMVVAARDNGVDAEVADLHTLALGRRYPKILCAGPLEFCEDPARVIERLADHLEPGGRLVVLFPTAERGGKLYQLYHRLRGIEVSLFSLEEMATLLERARLRVLAVREPASFSAAISAERPRG